jgi:hypothetical protein
MSEFQVGANRNVFSCLLYSKANLGSIAERQMEKAWSGDRG